MVDWADILRGMSCRGTEAVYESCCTTFKYYKALGLHIAANTRERTSDGKDGS